MVNKILLALFLIIMFLVVGEVGYYYLPRTASNQSTTTTPSTKPKPTAGPEQAISESSLQNLRNYKKGVLQSSVLSNTLQGEVSLLNNNLQNVKFRDEYGRELSVTYKLQIQLKGTNGKVQNIYFTERNLGRVRVVRNKNNKEEEAKLSDLAPGMDVRVTTNIDLVKGYQDSFVNGKIEIL